MVHRGIPSLHIKLHKQKTQPRLSYKATYIGRHLPDGGGDGVPRTLHSTPHAEHEDSADHTQTFHPIPGEGLG